MQSVVSGGMMAKTVHELEVEFTEMRTTQKHIYSKVEELHTDMRDVKKALFQAKWVLVGAVVFGGVVNSDTLLQIFKGLG